MYAATQSPTIKRRDLHQQVTDIIIDQLEAGTVPWHKPWRGGDNRLPDLPFNFHSGKKYRGINILMLWINAINNEYNCAEWGSFKQWKDKNEFIRKGEKGSLIVYYDTFEKEVDGKLEEIPFLKSSVVFNRCQLASYQTVIVSEQQITESLVERIEKADAFIKNTGASIEHREGGAYYVPSQDKIFMPDPSSFMDMPSCTATEGYYSTLFHELTHWTGSADRLDRTKAKKFGDNNYALEELIAELGAAFLCSGFNLATNDKGDHASYIAHWLQALRNDKTCIITAASNASKAVEYLHKFQE